MHPAAFKCKEISIGVILAQDIDFYLFILLFKPVRFEEPYHQVKESVVVNISSKCRVSFSARAVRCSPTESHLNH